MFKPGAGKLPNSGRKKGSLNKTTSALKEMILQALDNKGGVAYLEEQAEKNPNAFLSLVGKTLPLTVNGDKDNPLQHNVSITIVPVKPK